MAGQSALVHSFLNYTNSNQHQADPEWSHVSTPQQSYRRRNVFFHYPLDRQAMALPMQSMYVLPMQRDIMHTAIGQVYLRSAIRSSACADMRC